MIGVSRRKKKGQRLAKQTNIVLGVERNMGHEPQRCSHDALGHARHDTGTKQLYASTLMAHGHERHARSDQSALCINPSGIILFVGHAEQVVQNTCYPLYVRFSNLAGAVSRVCIETTASECKRRLMWRDSGTLCSWIAQCRGMTRRVAGMF